MENVRYMLSQYHHETSLYFGCRYMTTYSLEGYMAGGGYILSKKALSKFNEKIISNKNVCRQDEDGAEDFEMGIKQYFSFELMFYFTFFTFVRNLSSENCNIR